MLRLAFNLIPFSSQRGLSFGVTSSSTMSFRSRGFHLVTLSHTRPIIVFSTECRSLSPPAQPSLHPIEPHAVCTTRSSSTECRSLSPLATRAVCTAPTVLKISRDASEDTTLNSDCRGRVGTLVAVPFFWSGIALPAGANVCWFLCVQAFESFPLVMDSCRPAGGSQRSVVGRPLRSTRPSSLEK